MLFIEQIVSRVKDSSGKLTYPDDFKTGLSAALKRYSKLRPLEITVDIPGSGVTDYDLPGSWEEGLSTIVTLEYPAGQIPEAILDRRDWKLYQTPDGPKLRMLAAAPAAGETMRVTHTALHTEATVPSVDEDAVTDLAASICCTMLAAAFGQQGDAIIQADSVDHGTKTDSYRRLAAALEARFKEHFGIKDSDNVTAAMATSAPPAGRTRLTHGRS